MRLLLSIFLASGSAHDDDHGIGPGGPGHSENSKEMIVCDENEIFDDCPLCSDSMCDGTPQEGFFLTSSLVLIGCDKPMRSLSISISIKPRPDL